MTVIVLGFDALEHKLIEKYKLKNIKQDAYTRLDISDFPVVSTPPIWASMITGEIDERMISYWVPEYGSVSTFYDPILQVARKIFPSRIREFLNEFIRNVFYQKRDKSPLQATLKKKQKTNTQTVFSEVDSWHNEIPGFNAGSWEEKKNRFKSAFEGESKETERKAVMELIEQQFDQQVDNLFQVLKKKNDYELIFWYSKYLDEIGHIDRGFKIRTMKRYMNVNDIVNKVRTHLDSQDTLYIISDHGMKPKGKYGLHDKDAFFSSSDGKLIKKPLELYELLKNKTNANIKKTK